MASKAVKKWSPGKKFVGLYLYICTRLHGK